MKTFELSILYSLCLAGLVLSVGCKKEEASDSGNKPPATESQLIKIGAILPLTGPVADFGKWIQNGMTLGLEDVNQSGLAGSHRLKIIFEDSQNEGAKGVSAANKLLSVDRVHVLVSAMSKVSVPLIPIADEHRIPLVMQDVTFPRITSKSPWLVRHFIQSDREAEVMLRYAGTVLKIKSLAVLYVNDEAGVGARDALRKLAQANGVEIRAEEAFEPTARDLRTQVVKLTSTRPDAIYVFGNGPSWAAAIKQLRESNFPGHILTNAAMDIRPFRDLAGAKASEGVFFTMPTTAKSGAASAVAFEQKYRSQFGEDPPIEARYAWDIVHLIALAAAKGGITPEGLKNNFSPLQLNGAFGSLVVPADRDIQTPIAIGTIRSGQSEILEVFANE